MERLEAFEKMLSDIREQSDYETAQTEKLKAAGKEKSATYRCGIMSAKSRKEIKKGKHLWKITDPEDVKKM